MPTSRNDSASHYRAQLRGAGRVDQLHLLTSPVTWCFFGSPRRSNHVGLYLGRGLYRHSSGTEHGRNGIGVDSLHPTNNLPGFLDPDRSQLRRRSCGALP